MPPIEPRYQAGPAPEEIAEPLLHPAVHGAPATSAALAAARRTLDDVAVEAQA